MRSVTSELNDLSATGLRRSLRHLGGTPQGKCIRIAGRSGEVLNFSSNDYLGLANDPTLNAASVAAIQAVGTGSGASRLICGGAVNYHRQLEIECARYLGTQAALSFASGYAAAVGTVGALVRKGDVVIADKLAHACLIDGARLSGATLRVFPHNRIDRLSSLLSWATEKVDSDHGRILVITESVFSMDGDMADLRPIADLTKAHGAFLLVDEAHALGVVGPGGRGQVAEQGLEDVVDIRMATLGKAAGSAGGLVAAGAELVDLIANRARSFVFSTAPPPAQAAAGIAGIELLRSERGDQLREKLRENILTFRELLGDRSISDTAIQPVMVGDESEAVALAEALLDDGFLCPAIRFPTVSRGAARLRITLSAAHERDEIEALVAHLSRRTA